VSVLFGGLVAGPAQAQTAGDGGEVHGSSEQVEHAPAVADFEGHDLDLAGDWGEARACLVWRQGGVLECFRTPQALAGRERALSAKGGGAPGGPPQPASGTVSAFSAYSCWSSLRLFDYGGYGGRELDFWDRGFWQNLGDYGFDNSTSSYIVGGCYSHLAEYRDGAGWWYPGDTSPYHGEPYMYSSWNDRVSSIYIE
jgi:hypothetical protein